MKRALSSSDVDPLLCVFMEYPEVAWQEIVARLPAREILFVHKTLGVLSRTWNAYVESIPHNIVAGDGSYNFILRIYSVAMAKDFCKYGSAPRTEEDDLAKGKYPSRDGQMVLMPMRVVGGGLTGDDTPSSVVVALSPVNRVEEFKQFRQVPHLSLMGRCVSVHIAREEQEALLSLFPPGGYLSTNQGVCACLPMPWFDRAVETRRSRRILKRGTIAVCHTQGDFQCFYTFL